MRILDRFRCIFDSEKTINSIKDGMSHASKINTDYATDLFYKSAQNAKFPINIHHAMCFYKYMEAAKLLCDKNSNKNDGHIKDFLNESFEHARKFEDECRKIPGSKTESRLNSFYSDLSWLEYKYPPYPERYVDQRDGTVVDSTTGFQWMRCSLGQEWDGTNCVGKAEKFDWPEALAAAEALNCKGGYAGHRDWRLPTLGELEYLVRYPHDRPDTIDLEEFPATPDDRSEPSDDELYPDWYWSSSPEGEKDDKEDDEVWAWGIDIISNEGADFFPGDSKLRVRLVRGTTLILYSVVDRLRLSGSKVVTISDSLPSPEVMMGLIDRILSKKDKRPD